MSEYTSKYDFRSLAVGEERSYPVQNDADITRIRAASNNYAKRHPGVKFRCRVWPFMQDMDQPRVLAVRRIK